MKPKILTDIKNIENKIDKNAIVDDLITGGSDKVASAETVKVLKANLEQKADINHSHTDYEHANANIQQHISSQHAPSNAEQNVQSDWNVSDSNSDAYIKNKPNSMPANDVYAWAKASTKPTYTPAEVGAAPIIQSGTTAPTSYVGNGVLYGVYS